MRQTMAVIAAVLMAVALIGCNSAGSGGGGGSTPDIVSAGVAGADGFALVSNSPAELVKIENGVPQYVEWTLEDGSTVQVPVANAKQLGADYMMVEYDYGEERHRQAADRASGALSDVPDVANWDRIRYTQSKAWYVSGGQIVSVDPESGASEALSRAEDNVPGNALMLVSPGGVPFALDSSFKKSYPSPGNPVDLSGLSEATSFEPLSASEREATSRAHALYNEADDTYYVLSWSGDSWWTLDLQEDGDLRDDSASSQSLSSPFASDPRRIGPGLPQPGNSLFTDGYGGAVYTVDIVSGEPVLASHAVDYNAGSWVDESLYVDGAYYYRTNDGVAMQIREAVIGGSERKLVEVPVEADVEWTVAGGALFWFDENGDGWKMDLSTETVEAYEMSGVEAVTE